jgi:mRNA interferase RelE/StbE
MKEYKLAAPDSVVLVVWNLHPHLKKKIRFSFRMILKNPDEGKELSAELAGLRSFRVGRFRIIYRIRSDVIEIVAIGQPRSSIYLETLELLKKEKIGNR